VQRAAARINKEAAVDEQAKPADFSAGTNAARRL